MYIEIFTENTYMKSEVLGQDCFDHRPIKVFKASKSNPSINEKTYAEIKDFIFNVFDSAVYPIRSGGKYVIEIEYIGSSYIGTANGHNTVNMFKFKLDRFPNPRISKDADEETIHGQISISDSGEVMNFARENFDTSSPVMTMTMPYNYYTPFNGNVNGNINAYGNMYNNSVPTVNNSNVHQQNIMNRDGIIDSMNSKFANNTYPIKDKNPDAEIRVNPNDSYFGINETPFVNRSISKASKKKT